MSSAYPGEWSAWSWDDKYQRNICWRTDTYGNVEYAYDPPFEEQTEDYTTTGDYTTAEGGVDELSNSFAQTTISTYDYQNSPQTGSEPRTTPSYSFPSGSGVDSTSRRITTRNPDTITDELDPEFKVQNSKHFRFGKILKVLWSEPMGSAGTLVTDVKRIRRSKYGEPILTYGGRATNKSGVHASDHALIYSSSKAPRLQRGEVLEKRPIRVKTKSDNHKLDPNSRLNYAKLYTVEHNVKVVFIGAVMDEYHQLVRDDYNRTHNILSSYSLPTRNIDQDTSYAGGAASNLEIDSTEQ
ncbi:hypothetical protein PVAG01_04228 [Phlyctema vagabunda]|uniref:DUF6590 domain-containing protein n=1 Tax=Phlyctema vagabunda TaxID=108571 RepID=A0ABR4PNK9_9HELO